MISSSLLERLKNAARFSENQPEKLQQFADLCADVESQVAQLPGLACLNFANAMQPVIDKLPKSICAKWEKEIANFSDANGGVYPPFERFAKIIQGQANIKNNANVLASKATTTEVTPSSAHAPRPRREQRTFKTNAQPQRKGREGPENKKVNRCPYHERDGHTLAECKTFAAKTVSERKKWLTDATLCYRCLDPSHFARDCRAPIQCATCGDLRHNTVLHRDPPPPKDNPDPEKPVTAKCTALCDPVGGTSCSKMVLVDVYSIHKPSTAQRIYAIIDEQSNTSLITSKLADDLGADGPREVYNLSTCSNEREEKSGRRVTGIEARSVSGAAFSLPTLVECDVIPGDKREIPTPEMARSFKHLKPIADQIPPLDDTAEVHLLIGRDAPELLKVKEFKNGPRGAPWAQRLALGWTISGQMCLDFANGPAHILSRHTHVSNRERQETGDENYEIVPCPNMLKEISQVKYYTDSKVVLGYITNESRRFYVYVANRVQQIRSLSNPEQWRYVETELNPADLATRGVSRNKLGETSWLSGPTLLKNIETADTPSEAYLLDASDPEVRKEVVCAKVSTDEDTKKPGLGAHRFLRFSTLKSLQRGIATLIVKVKNFKNKRDTRTTRANTLSHRPRVQGEQQKRRAPTVEELDQALRVIIRTTQREAFSAELKGANTDPENPRETKKNAKKALRGSPLYRLDPFLDSDGILRVGGRLRRTEMNYEQKHPVLLPRKHHVSQLVALHHHVKVHHQGRLITSGATRQAGFWLIGGHATVTKAIKDCVTCKKLRGRPLEQRMADLPPDRTEVCSPFTNVGFDVFGPWSVKSRKTRGAIANAKRWGLVFTCLSSRAIHIEVLESMDTSAFICALRRFFALRGHAKLLRCDCGTNFVGAKTGLDSAMKELNKEDAERFVREQGCEWILNPPHASHFGGVWERQIRTIRRVLDGMFAELGDHQLTHDLLVTLIAEVAAIVNARPISALPMDADQPQPLSPAMLLSMKERPTGPPPGRFLPTDIYARRRWRCVQYLAEQVWSRWRREYLQNLQPREKWNGTTESLRAGDIILLRDETEHRNDWPLGRVTEAVKSEDGRVRKAKVEVVRDRVKRTYLRPIKELILLIRADDDKESQE
ncbi:uncharacterized protein LOC116603307 [Nematostella vectensis]|uniref:uncharacterized protein LOC116603307 n=1 Tax=Nematostella vectensis TaxID=45351 RepID=UPI0020778BAD|nr:uncharacterized protein LOC116603307 [Nematostella vectensis]